MQLDRLVYEVREQLSAISDDRWVSERYIIHTINVVRADFLRKLVTRAPYYNTVNVTQDVVLDMTKVSRSMAPNCPMNCTILRAENELPRLVYTGTLGNWFSIRPVDMVYRAFELTSYQKAGYLSFEFNVGYGFLNSDYFIYMLFKDNLELGCAVVTGIFEDPLEVDPDLEDYPLDASIWNEMKPYVIDYIRNKPELDPINNSEPDNDVNGQSINTNLGQ